MKPQGRTGAGMDENTSPSARRQNGAAENAAASEEHTASEDTRGPVVLGQGVLSWPTAERQSDRYGSVTLFNNPGSGQLDCVTWNNVPEGATGTLVAHIVETRESHHIGDFFRGIFPSTPNPGERIVLGTGTLFRESRYGTDSVGLRPADGRDDDWLDPRALYRCHDQTVRLEFEPAGTTQKPRRPGPAPAPTTASSAAPRTTATGHTARSTSARPAAGSRKSAGR